MGCHILSELQSTHRAVITGFSITTPQQPYGLKATVVCQSELKQTGIGLKSVNCQCRMNVHYNQWGVLANLAPSGWDNLLDE